MKIRLFFAAAIAAFSALAAFKEGKTLIPAEWKASKNRHDVHFCPMCAKPLWHRMDEMERVK